MQQHPDMSASINAVPSIHFYATNTAKSCCLSNNWAAPRRLYLKHVAPVITLLSGWMAPGTSAYEDVKYCMHNVHLVKVHQQEMSAQGMHKWVAEVQDGADACMGSYVSSIFEPECG